MIDDELIAAAGKTLYTTFRVGARRCTMTFPIPAVDGCSKKTKARWSPSPPKTLSARDMHDLQRALTLSFNEVEHLAGGSVEWFGKSGGWRGEIAVRKGSPSGWVPWIRV